MTYRYLTDLADALRAYNIPVVEHAGWQTAGRPTSTGEFKPTGVLNHHTASPIGTSNALDIAVIMRGNTEAPGPISQLYIGRDGAAVHILAAGRANHAGGAVIPHIGPNRVDGNANLIGIECGNNGIGEPWPDAQVNLLGKTNAALCGWYGWPIQNTYFHWFTGQPAGNFKIDPAGPYKLNAFARGQSWDMNAWRPFVASFTSSPQPPPPPPPPPPAPPVPPSNPQGENKVLKIIVPVMSNGARPLARFLATLVTAPNGQLAGQTLSWIDNGADAQTLENWGVQKEEQGEEFLRKVPYVGHVPQENGYDWGSFPFNR